LISDRHSVLKTWIAAVLWLVVITIESSDLASSNNTRRILYPLLHFLFGLDWDRFEPWHFLIRKGGHVFGYGLLSILLFRAWHATFPLVSTARWNPRWAGLAVVGTALVASLDEWHQSFLPSRTGTWRDVVLDTCAAIAAQVLIVVWVKVFWKHRAREAS
jgi:VanZ family protein